MGYDSGTAVGGPLGMADRRNETDDPMSAIFPRPVVGQEWMCDDPEHRGQIRRITKVAAHHVKMLVVRAPGKAGKQGRTLAVPLASLARYRYLRG